ncbi:MAG: glutamyl-tRNA reductase [Solirubrobacteraceae bacterium]|nr:glutamyl-tRNA reductase [Solirubrobacteraceae bacterium]
MLSAAGTRAPVAWRERLAVHADEGAAAAQLPGAGTIAEAIVLSTCERFDVYAVASDAERAERELVRWVAERSGSPAPAVANRVRTFHGRAAARHVIATAAGLHSAVLGEHEILGQVRRARDRAARAGATGPVLDRLAVDALRAGRRARATTSLGRGSLSVLSVGLELIADLCPGTGRRALVVGSSRTASAACERLRAFGWAVAPAADLSARSPLGTSLHEFHALVTCTGTSGKVVSADALADAAGQRGGTPLVVLDLSVPRDVDPRARYVEGVLLFDVDALPVVAEPALASRRAGVADAKRIVDEELDRFDAWRADQLLAPTIKALRDHVRGVLEDALAEADERTVERIVGRILHTPTRRLREARADVRGPASVQLLRWLFGVDGDPGGSAAARP